MDAAGESGERAGDAEGDQLVAEGGHAHHLGHVLVVVDGEQADAQLGDVDAPGDDQRGDGAGERHQVQR